MVLLSLLSLFASVFYYYITVAPSCYNSNSNNNTPHLLEADILGTIAVQENMLICLLANTIHMTF